MDDIFVGRVMSTDLVTVAPDTLVEDAAGVLLDDEIGSVLVVEGDGTLAGILTTTDFVEIVAKSRPKAETTVSRYMTTDLVTCGAQDTIRDAADAMVGNRFHHLPVVDEREGLIGILTTTDIAAYVSDPELAAQGAAGT